MFQSIKTKMGNHEAKIAVATTDTMLPPPLTELNFNQSANGSQRLMTGRSYQCVDLAILTEQEKPLYYDHMRLLGKLLSIKRFGHCQGDYVLFEFDRETVKCNLDTAIVFSEV